MSIKIKSIQDAGNPEKERIVFSVYGDTELGNYLVLISEVSKEGDPFSGLHPSYWFPEKKLKQGDLVILYTKNGNAKTVKNSDDSSSHFFYWHLNNAQLNSKYGIVLLTTSKWEFDFPKTDSLP